MTQCSGHKLRVFLSHLRREEGTAVSCLGSQTLSPLFITIVHSHSTFNRGNHRNLNHSRRLSLARRTVAALVRCSCCSLDCLLFTVRPLEPAAPAGTGPVPVYTVYSTALLYSTAVHCTVQQCTVQCSVQCSREPGRRASWADWGGCLVDGFSQGRNSLTAAAILPPLTAARESGAARGSAARNHTGERQRGAV